MIYRIATYLETGELLGEPSPKEQIDVCMLHMDRLIQIKGEKIAIMEMRKHAAWYLKGLKGNGRVRRRIIASETREGLLAILYEFAIELEAASQAS